MRKIMLLLFLIINTHSSNAQMCGNVWCFGDSVMMKFDVLNNVLFSNSYCSNFESAASIAHTSVEGTSQYSFA